MLRVGVPEYRLPTPIVNREVQEIIDLGIELRLNTRVENLDYLFDEGFNAVLIAVGAHNGKRLPIPGSDHPKVFTAVHFLRDVYLGKAENINGRHVLVLGGGNVALDSARTAVRLGAKQVDVACLEARHAMLADEHEIIEAEEEGIHLFPGRAFNRIINTNGDISGVEAVDVKFMQFEADGSLTLETVPNSEHILSGDMVFFAIGQSAGLAFIPEDSQVGTTRGGTVAVNPNTCSTSRPGVFAAGDATTGTAFVIEAVASGHQAAENIQKYLQGEELEIRDQPQLPVVKISPTEVSLRMAKGEIESQPRVRMTALESIQRRQTFDEVNLGYTEEEARAEAARCLQCGVCSECLSCYYKCAAGAINHDEIPTREHIDVGAVILASGFEPYDAHLSGEYGFGRFPNVVTSMQFERVLSPSGPFSGRLVRPSDGHEPKRIAWIQCVGSREEERNWCSAVCCMYATKQAIIAQEHAPGTECTIFYIDFRAYGKGFDAYYERAKEEGVRYIRALPSSVRQNFSNENLDIQYILPDGSPIQEEFDLVILSVGMQPPHSMADLAGDLGVALTEDGFCQTTNLSPLDTTRPGVYVCGPFAEPKDIPETVMSASAAAARSMTLLAEGRHSLIQPKEYPLEIDVSDQHPRVGVFVCHCGTNIAGVVDVDAVTEYARTLPDVVFADNNLFTCSTDSQTRIQEAIQEHNLNRVVVASCTPRTHEPIFQDTIRQVGLNFYLFELANIRDQCSWVHRDYPVAATEKAKDLVRMAVARVRLVEPLQRKRLEFNHDGLIIGGGLAGMTAALELADQGFMISLIEHQAELGGNMRHLHFLLSHANPQELLAELIEKINLHPHITTFLNAELDSFEGSLGKFKSTLKITGSEEAPQINHGVVIVATGAQPYQPSEYLYGQDQRILTQLELEEILAMGAEEISGLKSVVMIQCVGSRTADRPYCSRICCGQAIKNALEIKKINPDCEVYILYQDIRTYGLLEKYYRQSRDQGVLFLRFDPEQPPQVMADGALQVVVHDAMLETDILLEADRLVLSVATVPREDASQLAQLLKVPRIQDGFFQEAHMKLAPVDFASDGIFLCGMAHYPKKAVTESVIQAKAAAGRAATILSQRELEIEPIISHVLDEKCDGCAYCVDPCPFDAITLIEYQDESGRTKKRVVVDETICKGCGTCQATCPKDAIFISHFKLDYLRAMTMAALEV